LNQDTGISAGSNGLEMAGVAPIFFATHRINSMVQLPNIANGFDVHQCTRLRFDLRASDLKSILATGQPGRGGIFGQVVWEAVSLAYSITEAAGFRSSRT